MSTPEIKDEVVVEEKDDVAKPAKAAKSDGNVVTITTQQWQEVLNRLARAEQRGVVEKPKRITEHTATLRFCNDKAVVGFDNFREVMEEGRRIGYFDLTLEDGEVLTVPYLEFLNEGNGEKVKIVSQKAHEQVKSFGTVRAINPDPKNQKTWDGGMIDLEVTTVTYQAEVEVIEGPHAGKKISVPTAALNV